MLRTIHQKPNTDHPHQTDTLPLRPHHGMCLSYFSGKGYSTGFTANMARIKSLLEETDPLVRLTTGMDCICGACPNNSSFSSDDSHAYAVSNNITGADETCDSAIVSGSGICTSEEKVQRYDHKVLELTGLSPNTVLSWSSFRELVKTEILDSGQRRTVCADCQWDALCNPAALT